MKFSVVMPAYNRAFVIQRAIESVLKQTYSNWELIIINDGSKDNISDIVEEYLKYPNIKYISYEVNKGVNYARNRGIEKCSGEIITFLDSDDEFFPYTLEKANEYILKYLDKYDVFGFSTCNENGKKTSNMRGSVYTPNYEEYLCGKINGEYLLAVKRNIFEKFCFNENLQAFEGITWLQIAKQHRFIFINDILRVYWQDTESILRFKALNQGKIYEYIKGYNELIKLFDAYGPDKPAVVKKEYSKNLARLGYYHILLGAKDEGTKWTQEALRNNLFQMRAWRNFYYLMTRKVSIGKHQ